MVPAQSFRARALPAAVRVASDSPLVRRGAVSLESCSDRVVCDHVIQPREPSVQSSHSVLSDSATPRTAARQASLSITNSRSLLRLMSIQSVMPSSHLILCRPLLLLPSVFPRVFSKESFLLIRWPYWSFSFSISPSNEHPGLISLRMDWLDLLLSKGVFCNTTVQKHQFFGALLSL